MKRGKLELREYLERYGINLYMEKIYDPGATVDGAYSQRGLDKRAVDLAKLKERYPSVTMKRPASKSMSQSEYVARYGIEAYVTKAYRPFQREGKTEKLQKKYPEASVGRPVTVKKVPTGLVEFKKRVEYRMEAEGESYAQARLATRFSDFYMKRKAKYYSKKEMAKEYLRHEHYIWRMAGYKGNEKNIKVHGNPAFGQWTIDADYL